MDRTKFQPKMLLDTGVFIRALEHDHEAHKNDPRVKDSRDLWVELSKGSDRTEVYIAAPSVLEFMRGPRPPPELPLLPSLIYASFDYLAAMDMATWATSTAIKEVLDGAANTRRVVTYDALIVGTAHFYGVDVIVAYDKDVKKLAAKAGIACHEPSHFRADPTLFDRF